MRVIELEGKKTWVVLARSRQFPDVPEKSGIYRVDDMWQACVMQSDGKVGSKGVEIGTCIYIYVTFHEQIEHNALERLLQI